MACARCNALQPGPYFTALTPDTLQASFYDLPAFIQSSPSSLLSSGMSSYLSSLSTPRTSPGGLNYSGLLSGNGISPGSLDTGISGSSATSPLIGSLLSGSDGTLNLIGNAPSPAATNNYTEDSNGQTISLKLGDTIHVQLSARIDQGYLWNLSVTGGLNVTGQHTYPPKQAELDIGAGTVVLTAVQEWDIQAIEPGMQTVSAFYSKSGNSTDASKMYELTIVVSGGS